MNQLDQIVDTVSKIGLLSHLKDIVIEAEATDRRRCGNCYFWMMNRQCPREHNVNGMSRGPSCETPACDKFKIEQWVVDLKAKRVAAAIAFAERNDLPRPY